MPGLAGQFQAISGGLPDCLNHERFSESGFVQVPVGIAKVERG
jgi:hypothetical protein